MFFNKKILLMPLVLSASVAYAVPMVYPINKTVQPNVAVEPLSATIESFNLVYPIDATVFPIEANNWDIDANGQASPLTDGLLTLRYLFGFTGNSLINNAISNDATRRNATDIRAYLQLNVESGALDIDGNGEVKPLTDGLLLMRYLFGFKGATLIDNAIGKDASRKTTTEIEAYLLSRMP